MIVAALLALAAVFYRVALAYANLQGADWLHNFAPLSAIALCGAIYFPRRAALFAAPVALLLSDLILNAHYGVALLNWAMLPQYLALGLVILLGWQLRGQARPGRTFLAALGGSVLFYLVTNTAAWAFEPAYAKTAAGWVQALTLGLPEFQPSTIAFFRNSLLSDLAFTGLFLLCLGRQGRQEMAPAPLKEAEAAC